MKPELEDAIREVFKETLLTNHEYNDQSIKRLTAPRMAGSPRSSLDEYVPPHDNGLTKAVNQCGLYTTAQAAHWLRCSSKQVREIARRKLAPVPAYTIEWAGRTSNAFTEGDLEKMKEYLYGEDDSATTAD